MAATIHAPIIEIPPNGTVYIRAGECVYSISDWGDALMGGGRGPLVIESVNEKNIRCEYIDDRNNLDTTVIEYIGQALVFGEEE